MQDIRDTNEKTKSIITGVEEGEETQSKGTDNLLNRTIPENFPNLKEERITQGQEV
jgi:hypothetical protein